MTPLPIEAHLPEIQKALETERCAVVQAPPGAGKTTRVPLALLSEPWLKGKKIILLEPRRLAAVTCARHMAALLGEKVGETVGYRIRLDRKIGPNTRIEVVTEGIFTRKIQADPGLEDTGLVIFDEFHERNIHSDLGLALGLDIFEALRNDLRILVMSATLDIKEVSGLMNRAPTIVSRGKSFPVETVYCPPVNKLKKAVPIEAACEAAMGRAISETQGDILVFLPGVGEILRLASRLKESLGPGFRVLPLYGDLSAKDQAGAFAAPDPAERKVVLSTSIAETSVTIDGITVVIDSGLMRVPRFSPGTGMTRLETLPVSRASADQRRGRAGRTAPGTCYRLWSEYDHGLLKPFTRPEILSVDLAALALELMAWGVQDPGTLKWLDPPDPAAYDQAKALLKDLGALDEEGRLTGHGKKMAGFGLHPRLAHMVLKGMEKGQGVLACRLAAFLNERDFLSFDRGEADPDMGLRLLLMEAGRQEKPVEKGWKIHGGVLKRILESEKKLMRDFHIPPTRPGIEKAGALLAQAYPDRIAKKRNTKDHTFLTASGKGVFFDGHGSVSLHEYIVAVHLDGNPRNARIYLAAPFSREDLEEAFEDRLKTEQALFFDKKTGSVKAMERILFGAILVDERPAAHLDPDQASAVLMEEIRKRGLSCLPWTQKLTSLRDRACFLKTSGIFPGLPDVSDPVLEETLETWLSPFLSGILSWKELERMDLEAAFLSLLSWEVQKKIDTQAPTHVTVPSGSRLPVNYRGDHGLLESPVLAVRLQEMFGSRTTPKIAGRALTLHLLSPAGRPVQITRDLESFWKNAYAEVKKDLMGRYPKHFWPENPLDAVPTNRIKRKDKDYGN
nr:ATP-dependent helicase HrpB [Desulfobacula sp.]